MEKRASAAKADFDLIGSIGTTESRALSKRRLRLSFPQPVKPGASMGRFCGTTKVTKLVFGTQLPALCSKERKEYRHRCWRMSVLLSLP
jgi:hypothetical protein